MWNSVLNLLKCFISDTFIWKLWNKNIEIIGKIYGIFYWVIGFFIVLIGILIIDFDLFVEIKDNMM